MAFNFSNKKTVSSIDTNKANVNIYNSKYGKYLEYITDDNGNIPGAFYVDNTGKVITTTKHFFELKDFRRKYGLDTTYIDNNYTTDASSLINDVSHLVDELQSNRNSVGIYDNLSPNILNQVYFNRFGINDSLDVAINNQAYVFFTKPDLEIRNFLRYPNEYTIKPDILNMLSYQPCTDDRGRIDLSEPKHVPQYTVDPSINRKTQITFPGNSFIPILSNMILNFDAQDVVLKTEDTYKNKRGKTITTGIGYDESVSEAELTLNFQETSDYTITTLMDYWVEYIHQVKYNKFTAQDFYRRHGYLDYAISIYFFLMNPDGMTIDYYSRMVGVIPTNKPYSLGAWDRGDTKIIKVGVQFKYAIKEDNNLQILKDFNSLSGVSISNLSEKGVLKKYGDMRAHRNWGADPFIYLDTKNYKHKLLFDYTTLTNEYQHEKIKNNKSIVKESWVN